MNAFFDILNQYFTYYFVLPILVILGGYFTFRLRFIQLAKLKASFFSLLRNKTQGEGSFSSYQAMAAVLAGSFGTGNISGMVVALSIGGPGSLVWMWLMAFLGAAIQYASCLLAVKYRKKNKEGEYEGGPMYYLQEGLGLKTFAILFALIAVVAAFTAGAFVQVNSIVLPFQQLGISPFLVGISIAILTALTILGKAKRIANVVSVIVPFMACLYLGGAAFILVAYRESLLPVLHVIVSSAFGKGAVWGGILGFTLMRALTSGLHRAIFATDIGTGLIPLLQSGAKAKHAVVNGIMVLISPFLVMVVCTMTVLVLMVTKAWQIPHLESTNVVIKAFQMGMGDILGSSVVITSLFLFGFTTILAWALCLEKVVSFLFNRKWILFFHLLYILLLPLGSLLRVDMVWVLADTTLTLMLILNLVGIVGLSREVFQDTQDFFFPKLKPSVD